MIQEKGFNRGLSTREAEKRIADHGLNELKHNKKKSPILIFLSQFNDFLVWVLIGATIVSGIIGDKADAVTILIIVVVNAILGFVQEFRTEKSLEALQELAAPTCKVIRDGNVKVVNDIPDNIEGYDVLIVDDIVDSGITMNFVVDHVKKLGAKSIKTCVLLDKPSRRKVEITPDYCCFEIEDLFVVGYGLNYGDYYRNIPYVFAVTDQDR